MRDKYFESAFPVSRLNSHFLSILWHQFCRFQLLLSALFLTPNPWKHHAAHLSPEAIRRKWAPICLGHRFQPLQWGIDTCWEWSSWDIQASVSLVSRAWNPFMSSWLEFSCIFRDLWKSGSASVNPFDRSQEHLDTFEEYPLFPFLVLHPTGLWLMERDGLLAAHNPTVVTFYGSSWEEL